MAQRRAAAVLAQHQVRAAHAHQRWRHNLVAQRVGQHAVLVDAALVRKGVGAHNRLVGRGLEGDDLAQHFAGGVELVQLDAGLDAIAVRAHIESSRNLFQRRVARALANAVDGALHLPRAVLDSGQRIGYRQTQIVVAVRAQNDPLLVDGRNALAHLGKHVAVLLGGGVAHRVRHINGGGAGFHGNAHHFDKEFAVRACGVLGRELHVLTQCACQPHRLTAQIQSLLAANLQLVFQMQVARSEEDVDAGAVGKLQRARRHFNVFGFGARQRGDARLADGLRDGGNRGEIALGGHGKAGLDNVHAQVLQSVRHGQLFLRCHAAAGGLLAVAQRGVEKDYVI